MDDFKEGSGPRIYCPNCQRATKSEEWVTYKYKGPIVKRYLCSECYLILPKGE